MCKLVKIYSFSPMKELIRNKSFMLGRSVISLFQTNETGYISEPSDHFFRYEI